MIDRWPSRVSANIFPRGRRRWRLYCTRRSNCTARSIAGRVASASQETREREREVGWLGGVGKRLPASKLLDRLGTTTRARAHHAAAREAGYACVDMCPALAFLRPTRRRLLLLARSRDGKGNASTVPATGSAAIRTHRPRLGGTVTELSLDRVPDHAARAPRRWRGCVDGWCSLSG